MCSQQSNENSDISADGLFFCQCCGYNTLTEFPSGTFEICEICFWEDDINQSENPNYEGGVNRISLNQAKENFEKFEACEKSMIKNVRKSTNNDIRKFSNKITDFQSGMIIKLDNEFGIVINEKIENLYGIILWDTEKLNDLENWCGLFGSFISAGGEIINNDYKFKHIKIKS